MKFFGNYTAATGKALKASDRLVCQVCEDGSIFICNGYWIFKMTKEEYAAIAQPVSHCDAGNWRITSTGREPSDMNISRIWKGSISDSENSPVLEFAPMVNSSGKNEISGAFCRKTSTVHLYNKFFLDSINPAAIFRVKNKLSPAVAYIDDTPFAMVMPINPSNDNGSNFCRAVKAWFADQDAAPAEPESESIAELRAQLADRDAALTQTQQHNSLLRSRVDSLKAVADEYKSSRDAARQELEALQAQAEKDAATISELRAALDAAQNSKPTETTQPAAIVQQQKQTAEKIAARFSSIPGTTVTVKGAQSASPVIWIAAATQEAEKAVKAAGARWAAKRNAFYYNVA